MQFIDACMSLQSKSFAPWSEGLKKAVPTNYDINDANTLTYNVIVDPERDAEIRELTYDAFDRCMKGWDTHEGIEYWNTWTSCRWLHIHDSTSGPCMRYQLGMCFLGAITVFRFLRS